MTLFQIVEDRDPMAASQELSADHAADAAGASCHKYFHCPPRCPDSNDNVTKNRVESNEMVGGHFALESRVPSAHSCLAT
jgi:hypothetical protein